MTILVIFLLGGDFFPLKEREFMREYSFVEKSFPKWQKNHLIDIRKPKTDLHSWIRNLIWLQNDNTHLWPSI
jgi:hypothetical protein